MGENFDFEYVIIGIIFFLASGAIIYFENKTYKVNEENTSSFKYYSIKGAIILLIVSLYLIIRELMKII